MENKQPLSSDAWEYASNYVLSIEHHLPVLSQHEEKQIGKYILSDFYSIYNYTFSYECQDRFVRTKIVRSPLSNNLVRIITRTSKTNVWTLSERGVEYEEEGDIYPLLIYRTKGDVMEFLRIDLSDDTFVTYSLKEDMTYRMSFVGNDSELWEHIPRVLSEKNTVLDKEIALKIDYQNTAHEILAASELELFVEEVKKLFDESREK